MHTVSDVKQIHVYTAELSVYGLRHLRYKLLLQRREAGSKLLLSAILKSINSAWNKEELSDQRKEKNIL